MLDTGVGHGGEWRGCGQRKKDHTGRGHVVRICMGYRTHNSIILLRAVRTHQLN